MSRPFLTVLTAPVPAEATRVYRRVRAAMRPLVRGRTPRLVPPAYPGHRAVVRSVVEGLRAVGADFNFNPGRGRDVARVVYAPANEALRQACGWKRAGRLDFLVAGPVNALFVDECDGIVQRPEIDLVIVGSEWARWFYRDAPEVARKVRVCPVGVDAESWKPAGGAAGAHAVVYWKSGDEGFCAAVEAVLARRGYVARRITSRPGEHTLFTPEEFRRALDGAAVAVFLSAFETQGIALAEAWSMDVPTLAWDPRGPAEWRGRAFPAQSSCPFLTAATGRAWRTLPDLERALDDARAGRHAFRPRDWVLAHMTDAVRAAALDRLIRDEVAARADETVARR